jgi:nucleoside transporter
MFLEYAVQGVWAVPLGAFLMGSPHEGGLNMPAGHVAAIYATMAVGALVTPLVVGLLCDRLFAMQRVLAVLHFVGAALLATMLWWSVTAAEDLRSTFLVATDGISVVDHGDWIPLKTVLRFRELADRPSEWEGWNVWQRIQAYFGIGSFGYRQHQAIEAWRRRYDGVLQSSEQRLQEVRSRPAVVAAADRAFPPLFALMLAYACVYVPTINLANVVAFRNLPQPARQYGRYRAIGTFGWIAAGLFVGFAAPAVSPLPLLYAAIASAVLALICLTLPHTPPAGKPKSVADALGLPALRMLADRSFLVYLLTALLATALMPFHNAYTNKFLVDLHIEHPAAVQTLAQPTEILAALLIPWVWARLGTRWMLTLGLLASAGRFFMYATESPAEVIAFGLPLHGVGFALFYIAAALYVDREAPPDLRASAQGLATLVTLGVGGIVGNWFAGRVVEFHTAGGVVAWRPVWLVPAVGTMAAAVILAIAFGKDRGFQPGSPGMSRAAGSRPAVDGG